MNEAMKDIHTGDIIELNSLLYGATYVTTEKNGNVERKAIDKVPESSLMNSKSEWNCFRVPCAIVARDHVK